MAGNAALKNEGEDSPRLVASRSAFELFTPDNDIVVIGGPGGGGALKANRQLDVERRRELIKAVRGGEHVELQITAITFRQRDGSPNKNYLRLNPEKLSEAAASYVKMPFLVDHRSWAQSARQGTILASEAVELAHNWIGFRQQLQVVKPDAVISVLDGTLDRFSIAWSRGGGAVLCTAHKVDVTKRGSCGCWPGDVVEIDGAKQTVEFQWQNPVGTEVSGVNDPAVSGTRIEDVRAALSLELGLHQAKEPGMNFSRLAAILGLAALGSTSDEDQAIKIIESLKRDKLAAEQERDTARGELADAKKTAAVAVAKSLATTVDSLIEGAYKEGKLRYGRDEDGKSTPSKREARLRRIAKDDGIEALKAELGDMEIVVPLNRRELDKDPPRLGVGEEYGELEQVAEQLGLDVKDVKAEYDNLYGSQEG